MRNENISNLVIVIDDLLRIADTDNKREGNVAISIEETVEAYNRRKLKELLEDVQFRVVENFCAIQELVYQYCYISEGCARDKEIVNNGLLFLTERLVDLMLAEVHKDNITEIIE